MLRLVSQLQRAHRLSPLESHLETLPRFRQESHQAFQQVNQVGNLHRGLRANRQASRLVLRPVDQAQDSLPLNHRGSPPATQVRDPRQHRPPAPQPMTTWPEKRRLCATSRRPLTPLQPLLASGAVRMWRPDAAGRGYLADS